MRWDLRIGTCCAPGDLLAEGWLAPGSAVTAKGETTSVTPGPGSRVAGQGQQGGHKQLPEPGRTCIPSLQGRTSCPSPTLSFQQGPSELVFREQGFWGYR